MRTVIIKSQFSKEKFFAFIFTSAAEKKRCTHISGYYNCSSFSVRCTKNNTYTYHSACHKQIQLLNITCMIKVNSNAGEYENKEREEEDYDSYDDDNSRNSTENVVYKYE